MTKKKSIKKKAQSNTLVTQFDKERKLIINRAVIIGSLLASLLVPLFGFLDLVFKPDMVWTYSAIRIPTTAVAFTVFLLSRRSAGKKYPYPLAAILSVTVCGCISLMCLLDQGPTDPYYAGINLPLLGVGIMLPLTIGEGLLIFGLVWLTYLIPNMFLVQPGELGLFLNNNFFLVSTMIIAMVGSQYTLRHTRNQWLSHRRLRSAHKKIKNHANELEKKVQERTQRLLQSERLAVVGQLAGGIAHDFNNILTAILGISELLLTSLPEEDTSREDIESISRMGRRAADLVKQLLAFSRRQILVPKILQLNETIDKAKKILSRIIGENIELIVHTNPDLGTIKVDPVQVEQIILNLAVNARDAMPDGGKLIIETNQINLDKAYCKTRQIPLNPGKYAMLSVSDTGSGMKDEVISKIFEPFFTTKEKGRGTGLGLSSVYGIVKQSRGDIVVYSEEEKGTTFKVYLPIVEDEETKSQNADIKPAVLPRGKETILLVEDEDEVRTLTARMLEKQGYNVMQASEGYEAIALSKQYAGFIHLLMTDVIMPNMNGRILAEQLTTQRQDMKVLYLSGYTENMMMHQGILDLASSFLQKPYTLETLSYKIRTLFESNSSA